MKAGQYSRIGAVVLAAGASQRMGEPKQLLLLDGQPILQRTLENVRAAKVVDIVLVLGFQAEAIKRQLKVDRVKVIFNEAYEQGMACSLRAGLSALNPLTDAAFIVLADQPFVRPATLDLIINQYERSAAQIVIPLYQGFRGNPVLLDRSVFPEVMDLTGDIGCRAIFGDHTEGLVKMTVDDIGILLDIDSQADYARLQGFDQNTANRRALAEATDLRGREVPGTSGHPADEGTLIIVGTEPVALALARLGKLLHFGVTIADPLLKVSDVSEADELLNVLDFSRLPAASRRYVVIASHGKFDEEAVEQAFAANADYIALVANRKRAQELRRSLESKGLPTDKLATLHAPAGLEIGAKTAEEIALSVMAEIVSLKRKKSQAKVGSD